MSNAAPKPPQQSTSFNWRAIIGLLLIWILFAYFYSNFAQRGQQVEEIAYTAFKQNVRQNNVAEVTFQGQKINGVYIADQNRGASGNNGSDTGAGAADGKRQPGAQQENLDRFSSYLPEVRDPELMSLLEKHGVTVYAEQEEQSWFWRILIAMLPWLLILGFFIYTGRKMQQRMGGAGGSGVFGFAKSKAKRFRETDSKVSYTDVAGLENAKKEMQEVVAFLKEIGRAHV